MQIDDPNGRGLGGRGFPAMRRFQQIRAQRRMLPRMPGAGMGVNTGRVGRPPEATPKLPMPSLPAWMTTGQGQALPHTRADFDPPVAEGGGALALSASGGGFNPDPPQMPGKLPMPALPNDMGRANDLAAGASQMTRPRPRPRPWTRIPGDPMEEGGY